MPLTLRVRPMLAVVLALASTAPALHADADDYDARLVRAVAAKERALDADDAAHWQEALSAFRAADDLRDTPEALYEIGFAAQRLNAVDVAVEAYGGAIELGLGGSARDKAADYVAAHSGETATLGVEGPAGATLSVNGVARATLPLRRPLVVLAGHTSLEATKGGEHWSRELDLGPGTQQTTNLTPPSVEPQPPVGPAPPVNGTVAPSNGAVTTAPAPEARPSHSKAGAWALIGTGTAITIASAILVPVSNARIDQARADLAYSCQKPNGVDACYRANPGYEQAAQDQVDSIATYKAVRTGAWIGLGAGAVAIVTGIALAARSPASRPDPGVSAAWRVEIVPFPAPVLSVRRSF